MTMQPARHECHACYPLQAEKLGIQPVVGNTHGTHVEQVVSYFQKILRGSQLTWYVNPSPPSKGDRKQKILNLENPFSSVLSQFEKYNPSGNLKFNY